MLQTVDIKNYEGKDEKNDSKPPVKEVVEEEGKKEEEFKKVCRTTEKGPYQHPIY